LTSKLLLSINANVCSGALHIDTTPNTVEKQWEDVPKGLLTVALQRVGSTVAFVTTRSRDILATMGGVRVLFPLFACMTSASGAEARLDSSRRVSSGTASQRSPHMASPTSPVPLASVTAQDPLHLSGEDREAYHDAVASVLLLMGPLMDGVDESQVCVVRVVMPCLSPFPLLLVMLLPPCILR
jgi:hypothetical protein